MLHELTVHQNKAIITIYIDFYSGLSTKELDITYNTKTSQWSGGILVYGSYYSLNHEETIAHLKEYGLDKLVLTNQRTPRKQDLFNVLEILNFENLVSIIESTNDSHKEHLYSGLGGEVPFCIFNKKVVKEITYDKTNNIYLIHVVRE